MGRPDRPDAAFQAAEGEVIAHQRRRDKVMRHIEEKARIEQEIKRAAPEMVELLCQEMTATELAKRLSCSTVWLSAIRRGQERMRLSGRPVKVSMEMYCKLVQLYEES